MLNFQSELLNQIIASFAQFRARRLKEADEDCEIKPISCFLL